MKNIVRAIVLIALFSVLFASTAAARPAEEWAVVAAAWAAAWMGWAAWACALAKPDNR
jgi:hypothetical protein